MTAFAFGSNTLNWECSKRQLLYLDATGTAVAYPDKFAVIREDTERALGVVGKDYELFQNSDLLAVFQPLVEEGLLNITNQGWLSHGQKTFVQAELAESFRVVGEDYKASLTLLNSHGGTHAVSLGTTMVRVICSNTWTAAHKQLQERFKHTEGVTERVLSSTAAIDFVNSSMKVYSDYCEKLATTKCSKGQFQKALEAIYDKPVDKMRASVVDKLNHLFYSGTGNEGKTFYDALNSFTELSTHFSRKTASARLNYSQFGQGANINRRAMAVLTEMAVA